MLFYMHDFIKWKIFLIGGGQFRERERERELVPPRGGATQRGRKGNSWELGGVIGSLGKEPPLVGNTKSTIQVNCKPNSKPVLLNRI